MCGWFTGSVKKQNFRKNINFDENIFIQIKTVIYRIENCLTGEDCYKEYFLDRYGELIELKKKLEMLDLDLNEQIKKKVLELLLVFMRIINEYSNLRFDSNIRQDNYEKKIKEISQKISNEIDKLKDLPIAA